MNPVHKDLASGRWFQFSLAEQLANVGSEVERTISWRDKGNTEYSRHAFERALELLSLTLGDPKNKTRLKELSRLQEVLIDYFACQNSYHSSDALWRKYFYNFNYLARVGSL
jgi:hypothetical protein